MRSSKRNKIVLLLLVIIMATFAVQPVSAENYDNKLSGESMVADLLLVRPLSIVATVVGCVTYVLALPFTAWNKDMISAAGKNLVIDPGKYTFVRPLGEF